MAKNPISGKEKIKIIFLRSPRHFWPIVNESDNFLLPLGYPCLAAYLREHNVGVECEILDCCPNRIGYKTLARLLAQKKPDVVGIGEKVVYTYEGFKAFELVKQVLPGCITIAGGHVYSHLPEWSMRKCPAIDYIVRFEGEETLSELIEALRTDGDLSKVKGIVYREGNAILHTPPRQPIQDLDTLPIPAYDLADVDKYAPFGKLWHKATTIQRSRGCTDNCSFCSWWVMEGKHELKDGKLLHTSHFRTKSVDRVLEETELLYEKHGVRYLFWVDATWNIDDEWLEEYCSELIRRNYKLGWWAFVRADNLIEQERKGVLELMVKAGLRHVLVGVERVTQGDIHWIEKHNYFEGTAKIAFDILRKKYPQVFRQGTILTGIRTETKESMEQLLQYAFDCHLDFAAFHPITPFPGTRLWDRARAEGWLDTENFDEYDMFVPVMSSEHLSREEIAELTIANQQNFVKKKPWRYVKGLFSRHEMRRRLHWWFLFSIGRILAYDAYQAIMGRKQFAGFSAVNSLWKPRWYED